MINDFMFHQLEQTVLKVSKKSFVVVIASGMDFPILIELEQISYGYCDSFCLGVWRDTYPTRRDETRVCEPSSCEPQERDKIFRLKRKKSSMMKYIGKNSILFN